MIKQWLLVCQPHVSLWVELWHCFGLAKKKKCQIWLVTQYNSYHSFLFGPNLWQSKFADG